MRVTLDTNVLVSFLLSPGSPAPPSATIRAALAGRFELVLPVEVLDELRETVQSKPYLSSVIPAESVNEFISLISRGARITPMLQEKPAHVSRDPGDDFLITHAVLEAIDFLVSGDKDLLVLRQIADTRIVSPAAFLALLDEQLA